MKPFLYMLLGIALFKLGIAANDKYKQLNNSTGGRYTLEYKGKYYTCENQRNGRYCLNEDGQQAVMTESDWRRAQLGE